MKLTDEDEKVLEILYKVIHRLPYDDLLDKLDESSKEYILKICIDSLDFEETDPDGTEARNALRMIIRECEDLSADGKSTKSLVYAVPYARPGLHMTGETLRVQCMYVLGNITHWRGPIAKEVRKVLKEYVK